MWGCEDPGRTGDMSVCVCVCAGGKMERGEEGRLQLEETMEADTNERKEDKDRGEREVKHVVAPVWWFHRGPASVAHEGERFASGQL